LCWSDAHTAAHVVTVCIFALQKLMHVFAVVLFHCSLASVSGMSLMLRV